MQPKFEATRRLVEPPSREGAGTPEGGPPRESDAVQIGKPRDPVSGTDERQESCEQDATQHSQAEQSWDCGADSFRPDPAGHWKTLGEPSEVRIRRRTSAGDSIKVRPSGTGKTATLHTARAVTTRLV